MNDSSPVRGRTQLLPGPTQDASQPSGESDRTAAEPTPNRIRRLLPRMLAALLVIVAAGVAGWHWLSVRWAHVYLDDARIATTLVTVSSAVTDVVTKEPISAGDHVKSGQLLIGIDATRTEAELKQIDAERAGIDAQQAQLRAQREMVAQQTASKAAAADAALVAAEADQKASAAALANAKAEFDRVSSLRDSGVSTARDFDQAQAAYIQADQQERRSAANVRAAEANQAEVEAEKAQLSVLDHQIVGLDAQRAANEALRAQKLVDLQQREIRAAFSGVVDATFINVGELATPGQRLFTYHDPNDVWVNANVKETDIRDVKLGAPAVITVDAYPGRSFVGKVIEVGTAATSEFALLPSPNPSGNFTKVTQRLPIKIAVDQVDDLLRPGMMVEASIDVVH